jgi:hypothetical protein
MSDATDTPRLLADAMLGKLARWLRLLGYDTLYLQADDDYLAHRARTEQRVLLTRDRELARRRGLNVVKIQAQTLDEQLAQVVSTVGPPVDATPRCMQCNVPLEPIPKTAAQDHVPAYVARTHEEFNRCPKCQKVTWRGSHWERIQARLEGIVSNLRNG